MSTTGYRDTKAQEDVKVLPTSFAQQRFWLLDQLGTQRATYHLSVCLRQCGRLDVAMLEQSLNAIVHRHEVLRTTFPLHEGHLVQRIAPALTVPLPVVDLRPLAEAEQATEAERLATEKVRQPFDLERGPLLRATVLQLGGESYLLLTLHQIICDAWSLGVLCHELATFYQAFTAGLPIPLPELPMKYTEFVVRQRERLQEDVLTDHLVYWKQRLAGAPAALELPTDRPRPPVPTQRGATQFFALSQPLTEALQVLSDEAEVTLEMILVAAFATLLHRYTGQTDLLLGTLASGRTQAEVQQMLGAFVNPVVLRIDLSGNPSFREFLERAHAMICEVSVHAEVPFEYIVKELQPERSPGQNSLFQVLLALESPLPALPSGWTATHMEIETGTSQFDLSLILQVRPEGLMGRFEYSSDLFDASSIVRMVGHWQTLLEGIVADPAQRLAELPLLTEVERHQLLVEWNATQADYPADQCIHQLFEAQVQQTPEAVAVVFEHEQLTFHELNQRANQLAHRLQTLGVGPEVRVGLCLERSLELVVGLLGVLKAGGAYVPLDPAYPNERLAFMAQDAHLSVLLTQQRLLNDLPTFQAQILCLDRLNWQSGSPEDKLLRDAGLLNVSSRVRAENLAYVIYTSGSTGTPKGVMISHRALCNHMCWLQDTYPLTPADRVLQKTAFSFDVSVWEFFWPLLTGARLVLARPGEQRDPAYLVELIVSEQISVIYFVASMLSVFLQAPGLQRCQSLKHVFCGGEALPYSVQQHFFAQLPAQLHNIYGPTETTIDVTSWTCQPESPRQVVPIGRPIANTQIYLLDPFLQPVPVGIPGELYIGGANLARGYLNRPELTAERFLPHPFSQEPGARLYRTGDLARYLPDGSLEFLGRLDHQVKLRGFRIELGEIEARLSQHPAVHQAVVVAREDVPGDKRLVAYVVLRQQQLATVNDLQSHLMKHVPTYMVPSAFVLLEALPLTPNGKVDRRALPVPEPTRSMVDPYIAPTLLVHQQLVQIWEELLDVRPIGIRDNFFDLGGHSLLAARLINRIEQVCGKKLPLTTLFAGATIECLADALQVQEDAGSRASLVAVQVLGSKLPFFFLHGDWTGGAFYCLKLARYLGSDQPFYVLEPYSFAGLPVPPSIEVMAAAHIQSMCAIQPEGPYLLGGFCNGGLIAYEMARQLQAAGQKVNLLVLMDSIPSRFQYICAAIRRIGKLMRLGEDKQLNWFLRLEHAFRYLLDKNSDDFEHIKTIDPRISTFFPPVESLRMEYPATFYWATANYRPGFYPGKVTLFWDAEEPVRRKWWNTWAKGRDKEVEEHIIPGSHTTCKTEHLHGMAEHLSVCLSKVQTAALSE
jgi:amino acid adenylation domain-containing protein